MDDALAELTHEWMTKAWHDLQTARITSGAPGGPLDTAIYHCRQAAEKTVKGWLTAQNVPFEKTHDIRRLIRQTVGVLPDFARFTAAAGILTPYASAFRYPGLTEESMPTQDEFDEALRHAETLYDFALGLLPANARPQSG